MAFVATSCSSDEPGVAPEGNFTPTETETITFNISNPEGGIRSRGQDANGWFGDGQDAEELQYCIYMMGNDNEWRIWKSSDNATDPVPVKIDQSTGNSWNLSVPIIKGAVWEAYFYADFYGKQVTDYRGTKVEWSNKCLHFVGRYGNRDNGDAFFGSISSGEYANNILNGDESTIILKRPLMQVNMLSNEFDDKTIQNLFPLLVETSMQFSNGTEVGIPEYYYFMEDRLTFKNNTMDDGDGGGGLEFRRVKYNGKQYDLFFMGYFLAPKTSSTNSTDWPTAPSELQFRIYTYGPVSLDKIITVPFSSLGTNPYTQNTRVIIYTDISDGGSGFISEDPSFHVDITPGWDFNDSNLRYE